MRHRGRNMITNSRQSIYSVQSNSEISLLFYSKIFHNTTIMNMHLNHQARGEYN